MSDLELTVRSYFPELDADIETAIEEALEGKPRANQLLEMVGAMERRAAIHKVEMEASLDPVKREALRKQLAETKKRLLVLKEEAAITGFVESSVRRSVIRVHADEAELMKRAGLSPGEE